MPKKTLFPAPAGPQPLVQGKRKSNGFDPATAKAPKAPQAARLTMKKNLQPGRTGQR